MDRILFEQDVIAPEDEQVTLEFEAFLHGKIQVSIINEVPGPSNAPTTGRPTHQRVFTKLSNVNSRAPWQRKMSDDDGNALYPLLIFDSLEWEGPIVDDAARQKRQRYEPGPDATEQEVRNKLAVFTQRAWRRPITSTELDRYMRIFASERKASASVRSAWKMAMLGVLTPQNFYYLSEGMPGERRMTVNDWELATRLSYFLWSSAPDDQLFAAAATGKLRDARGLTAQFMRMVADPRAKRFTDSFPKQWLQLGKLGDFPPDPKL